jgi:hypothetical protein
MRLTRARYHRSTLARDTTLIDERERVAYKYLRDAKSNLATNNRNGTLAKSTTNILEIGICEADTRIETPAAIVLVYAKGKPRPVV